MPDHAASLRPTGRSGLGRVCASVGLVLVVAAGPAPAAPRPAEPAAERGGLARLWSTYPIGPRADSGARDPAARATSAAPQPAPVTRSLPSLDSDDDPVRLVLLAAFGVSVSASALLLTLFLITAERSGVFARWAVRRRASLAAAPYARASLSVPPPQPARAAQPATGDNGRQPAVTHLVFVPTEAGYAMVEAEGEPPEVGSRVKGRYRVTKVGPSPLPEDRRRCVYLERM